MSDQKTQTTARCTFEVGLALRGGFRKLLEKLMWEVEGSKYKEVKGFLDSTFYVQSTSYAIKQLCNFVDRINKDD
jgi:hypothetical protein